MRTEEIDFNAAVINVRDIVERLEYLQFDPEGLTDYEKEELQTIEEVLEEIEGCGGDVDYRGNWYPLSLIAESYFSDYIREEIEECYNLTDIPSFIEIDWDATADNCRVDYSSVDINGEEYYCR